MKGQQSMKTAKKLQALVPDYYEAYGYLLKSIRSSLGVKIVCDWEGYPQTYVPTLRMLRRVGHQLSAATAIAQLSDCWDPASIIDITELQELEQKWQLAWEKRLDAIAANPLRSFR